MITQCYYLIIVSLCYEYHKHTINELLPADLYVFLCFGIHNKYSKNIQPIQNFKNKKEDKNKKGTILRF